MGCHQLRGVRAPGSVVTEAEERAAACIQRRLVRELDPITHRPIRCRYALCRGGIMHVFDAETLFTYIVYSGDLTDPLCRSPYARHELMRLERLVQRKLTANASQAISEQRDHEMLLDVLVDEVIHETSSLHETMTIAAVDNIRTLLRSGVERDSVVARLCQMGVSHSVLAPLILLLFDDDAPYEA